MKILVTTATTVEGERYVLYAQNLPTEQEGEKHELITISYLPEREGYGQELIYDNLSETFKYVYKKIVTDEDRERERLLEEYKKLEEQNKELAERTAKAEKAIDDVIIMLIGGESGGDIGLPPGEGIPPSKPDDEKPKEEETHQTEADDDSDVPEYNPIQNNGGENDTEITTNPDEVPPSETPRDETAADAESQTSDPALPEGTGDATVDNEAQSGAGVQTDSDDDAGDNAAKTGDDNSATNDDSETATNESDVEATGDSHISSDNSGSVDHTAVNQGEDVAESHNPVTEDDIDTPQSDDDAGASPDSTDSPDGADANIDGAHEGVDAKVDENVVDSGVEYSPTGDPEIPPKPEEDSSSDDTAQS